MLDYFNRLVTSLQSELQEYGGLLHLFDQQQLCIVAHNPTGFLEINQAVEAQLGKVTQSRLDRETLVRQAALELGWPADAPLANVLNDFPSSRQPLLQALVDEINDLVGRTQRRTRQNRMLLAQSLEMARQIVGSLDPQALTATYSPRGEIHSNLNRESASAHVA